MSRTLFALSLSACLLAPHAATAQCDQWTPTPGPSGLSWVTDLAVIDHDGPGPLPSRLYAANTPSTSPFNSFCYWDSLAWRPITNFTNGATALYALTQPAAGLATGQIIVGGSFIATDGSSRVIAAWDGQTLTGIGPHAAVDFSTSPIIRAITTWDPDGPGPIEPWLIVGGIFTRFGGSPAAQIAAWDGLTWRALGSINQPVNALISYDPDADGPALPLLIAGGGTQGSGLISAWNGAAWQTLGAGLNSEVLSLALFDPDADGAGPSYLYAGGTFTTSAAQTVTQVARWDGALWTAAGTNLPTVFSGVQDLRSLDIDGPGPNPARLVAAGLFTAAPGPARSITIFDGTTWTTPTGSPSGSNPIYAVEAIDPDGPASRATELIAGGRTTTIGASIGPPSFNGIMYNGFGAYDGQRWGPLGNDFVAGRVFSFYWFDDDADGPNPPALYASGSFTAAGGNLADGLARWDGTRFIGMGTTVTLNPPRTIRQLTTFDPDGAAGPAAPWLVGVNITASGFQHVLRWNNGAWTGIGSINGSQLLAITAFDEDGPGPRNPRLFAAGNAGPSCLLVWNGTAWVSAGTSRTGPFILFFTHDEDGPGPGLPHLFAMNDISVLRWNGTDWDTYFTFFAENNSALWYASSWDSDGDGPGLPEVVVAAGFTGASGSNFVGPAAYDGARWRQLGNSFQPMVRGLGTFDPDGPGPIAPQLTIGYSYVNNKGVNRLFNSTWSDLGAGLTNTIDPDPASNTAHAFLTVDPDNDGPLPSELWIGGTFTTAGGQPAANFARWRLTTLPPVITQHPLSTNACTGDQRALSITATGDGPLTYQWRIYDASLPTRWRNLTDGAFLVGGQQVATITSATTPTLHITTALPLTTASFSCVVTGPCAGAISSTATLTHTPCCGTADFNHDGDSGTDEDIQAFFACLAGTCCTFCNTADFNNDGDTGTDADIESFFRVLAGGSC